MDVARRGWLTLAPIVALAASASAAAWGRADKISAAMSVWKAGVRLGTGICERIGAGHVYDMWVIECADGCYEGMEMATAFTLRPNMGFKKVFQFVRSGHGLPFKILVRRKLGFRCPKFVFENSRDDSVAVRLLEKSWIQWFSGIR